MKLQRKQILALLLLAVLAAVTALGVLLFQTVPVNEPRVEASSAEVLSSLTESSKAESSNPSSESPLSSEEASSVPSSRTEPKPPSSTPEKKPQSSAPPASSAPSVQKPQTSTPSGKYIVGYYASWARSSGLPATSLDASLLTHINYAFADISSNGELRLPNSTTDLKNFEDLRTLKRSNPHLKTLISVGGWDYSSNFSSTAANASARSRFAQSCADFIVTHGFDGVDLDWEFPKSADRQNFTLLLKEIRSRLDQLASQNGRPYYLTIAGSPDKSFLSSIEPQAVASLVDYIFLMGYDMHGPWDKYADLNAPLYPTSGTSPHYSNSLSQSVSYYKNAGVPAKKIILGMPLYGYQYTTTGSTPTGLFSPFTSAKSIGYDKLLAGPLANSSFRRYFSDSSRVPYLYDGTTFISYDDESSIAEKATFALSNGLGGVGAWELSHDREFRLLGSAFKALNP